MVDSIDCIILTASIMVTNDIDKHGSIEFKRFMKILNSIKVSQNIQVQHLIDIAGITKTEQEAFINPEETRPGVLYYYFMKVLYEHITGTPISERHPENQKEYDISDDEAADNDDQGEEEKEEEFNVRTPSVSEKEEVQSRKSSPSKVKQPPFPDFDYNEDLRGELANEEKPVSEEGDPQSKHEGKVEMNRIIKELEIEQLKEQAERDAQRRAEDAAEEERRRLEDLSEPTP